MSTQEQLNNLQAQVNTLTVTLKTFMANHEESMATLTALLKAELNKSNELMGTLPNDRGSDNVEVQPSMSTLEALTQNEHEGFTEYYTRWRSVYVQIPNRPGEHELVPKFIDSLDPTYQGILRCSGFKNFKDLASFGVRIEAGIRSGTLIKLVGQDSQNTTQDIKCEAIEESLPPNKKAKRELTPLPRSYCEVFNKLRNMNLLQPLGPTKDPPVDKRPVSWNSNAFCLYHRGNGHHTEQCFRLKHKIQDMIDSGDISDPSNL